MAHEGMVATSLHHKRVFCADLFSEPGLVSLEDEALGIQRMGMVHVTSLAASKSAATPAFGVMIVQRAFGLFDPEDLEILTTLGEHVRAAMLRVGEGAGGMLPQADRPVVSGASAAHIQPPVA
mmetsp:Transcript_32410/g.65051  ORF Transcript_32410/g.65051 Transcript_32410/m.65051 type:complete len:123 (-) Transcript_32410:39-407(-)